MLLVSIRQHEHILHEPLHGCLMCVAFCLSPTVTRFPRFKTTLTCTGPSNVTIWRANITTAPRSPRPLLSSCTSTSSASVFSKGESSTPFVSFFQLFICCVCFGMKLGKFKLGETWVYGVVNHYNALSIATFAAKLLLLVTKHCASQFRKCMLTLIYWWCLEFFSQEKPIR